MRITTNQAKLATIVAQRVYDNTMDIKTARAILRLDGVNKSSAKILIDQYIGLKDGTTVTTDMSLNTCYVFINYMGYERARRGLLMHIDHKEHYAKNTHSMKKFRLLLED